MDRGTDRARRHRRLRRQRAAVVVVALAAVGGVGWWALARPGGGGGPAAPAVPGGRSDPAAATVRAVAPATLAERPLGALGAPLQDAAAARLAGGRMLLLGGLDAADASVAVVRAVGGGRERVAGRLPVALHDAAAVELGGAVYLFGGGNGSAQTDRVLRVDPGGAGAIPVGRLPAAASDVAAAALGGTAYIVGGYTGSRWLDTVVAWRPGAPARVVARLPTPVRYAAAAAVGGRILVAGGSLPSGAASDRVLAVDPASGAVRMLARLPAPTTHAAAAELGGALYVIGGRGASVGTPTDRVVRVDPATGRARLAGRLLSPRSDLAAVAVGRRILLAGGREAGGTVGVLSELAPAKAVPARAAGMQVPNVYANEAPGRLSPVVRGDPYRIYVPNSGSGTVDVIDPATRRIVEHFATGALPQHVTPSWDLRTLWVSNDQGNSLTEIDPRTTRRRRTIHVDDPYNLYFTPDGRFAIVVAERNRRLDFRDAHSMALVHRLSVPCRGVDHMDFSADGASLLASCEFSGQLVRVDVARQRVVGTLDLPRPGAMPQDVKLSPDGAIFYVADMSAGGVWEIDGTKLRVMGFLPTGAGAHGLYPSRDARLLYVTNRTAGTVSVVSFATRRVVRTWSIPGGSPDMGGLSPDGRTLWLSGRYDAEVYAIDTTSGRLEARIPVGQGPHGLCVWPQPGRYSLGHTGILR